MKPKVTIIIPVYNVEQYLRQCLDSVVGQTLQDIQILCVDHSSTDGSLALLEEFAARDSRIQIVNCPNTGGGPAQARNAGLAHVTGKYIHFLDSDDWLEPTLYEEAYNQLEQGNGDVMLFYAHEIPEPGQEHRKAQPYKIDKWPIQSEASDYFNFLHAPWNRVIRTSYLEGISLRYPEGKLAEDIYFHWALLSHEPRVIFVPKRLYYYRLRKGSIASQCQESLASVPIVYSMVKQYLVNTGVYTRYRRAFLSQKLCFSAGVYNYISSGYKDKVKQSILGTLDEDEIVFVKEEKGIDASTRNFYYELLGLTDSNTQMVSFLKKANHKIFRPLEKLLKKTNRIIFRPVENLVRRLRGKPIKTMSPTVQTESQIIISSLIQERLAKVDVVLSHYPEEFFWKNLTRRNIQFYYVRTAILKSLTEFLPTFFGSLLDIGCGIKPYRDYILDNNKDVVSYTGVDIGVRDTNNAPEVLWDGTMLPLDSDSFDCIICTEVLEHCFEPDVILAEIHRVLKPGGVFFFTVPVLAFLHEVPYDAYRYTPFCLEKKLIKTGFKEIDIRGFGGPHGCFAQALGMWAGSLGTNGWLQKNFLRFIKKFAIIPLMNICIKREERFKTFYDGAQVASLYGIAKKCDTNSISVSETNN